MAVAQKLAYTRECTRTLLEPPRKDVPHGHPENLGSAW